MPILDQSLIWSQVRLTYIRVQFVQEIRICVHSYVIYNIKIGHKCILAGSVL